MRLAVVPAALVEVELATPGGGDGGEQVLEQEQELLWTMQFFPDSKFSWANLSWLVRPN